MEIGEVLGPGGLLGEHLPGFSWRPQQQEMAEAVLEAFRRRRVLVAEAGTGTGKTLAYLVPALLWGGKVVVSTGTRNLQDQLFHRDLPLLRRALDLPVRTALLKGRANYLCRHRLENALQDPRGHRPEDARHLRLVQAWSLQTGSGDLAELSDLPEASPVRGQITSTADNCLGGECPEFERCHLVEARRRAQEADLVVVNHHLLCADFGLREEGFGELLPAADAYVVDEAHQLPEVAGDFFGRSVSTRQLLELCRDCRLEYAREALDQPGFTEQVDRAERAVRDFRLAFGEGEGWRGAWSEVAGREAVARALDGLLEALAGLEERLSLLAGRGRGLDSCGERVQKLRRELEEICRHEEADAVRWFEVHARTLRLACTPLEVAGLFRQRMERRAAAWVFTSATLAVGESFDHFLEQLGLDGADTARWESPFDYARQALWYVPRGLPDPAEADYTRRMMEAVLPLLEASGGRAFLLFTSHRALREAAAWLEGRTDLPLLVQGSAPRAELVERFVAAGNGVLLGTSSFWEGVDVRGEALSLVVIDRLPFASPGDPVLRARLDAIRRRGGNPFTEYQLPRAVIALRQGAGRLIRDERDRGVLVVCDPRLLRNRYGHAFLEAMPGFARTREPEQVLRFFGAEKGG